MKLNNLEWNILRAYLLSERKLSNKESSISADKSRYRTLSLWFEDKDWTRNNFNQFIEYMRSKDSSPSYMNNFIKMGKHVDKYFKTNELEGYTYFKERNSWVGEVLTPEEITNIANLDVKYKRYKDYINQRNRFIYLIMGTTGCRIDETLSLKREDMIGSNMLMFRDTKNNDDRSVPISEVLFKEIKDFAPDKGLIFLSARGRRKMRTQETNSDLKVRARLLRINKRVYNHLFRHSYITEMLELGVDWISLAKITGHLDPKVMARYNHILTRRLNEISLMHPLRKGERTFEQTVQKIKECITQQVDTKRFEINMKQNSNELILRLTI